MYKIKIEQDNHKIVADFIAIKIKEQLDLKKVFAQNLIQNLNN